MSTAEEQATGLPRQVQSDLELLGVASVHEFLGIQEDAEPQLALQIADLRLQELGAEQGDPRMEASRRLAQHCRERFQVQAPAPAAAAPGQVPAPPPAEPLPPAGPTLGDVLTQLAALRDDFAAKIRYDATKDKQIDKLHSDLQEQKQDVYLKIMRPLFFDLIDLQDKLYELVRHAASTAEPAVEKLRSSIETLADVVDGTLERYDVIAFREPGEVFVAQKQRAERAVDTQDPARDRCIAERLKKGFLYKDRVLRPELVATYRLKR